MTAPRCQVRVWPCERFGTTSVVIPGVGPRTLCQMCVIKLAGMGLEPIRMRRPEGNAA